MNKLINLWNKMMDENPNWREGQALFNVIYQIDPEFVDKYVRNTEYDPFYDDSKIQLLLDLYESY